MTGNRLTIIGQPVRKVDGIELVTGQARFAGDLRFSGLLHGYARRAGIPAGYIKSVNIAPAFSVPGVVDILLGEDIPGPNIIGVLPPYDQPLLATDQIRYEGESICLVIAESRQSARAGARAIEIELEELDPVLDIDLAMKDESRKIHSGGNINVLKKLLKGDIKEGFKQAEVVVENTYQTSFQEHAYLEPEAVCVVPTSNNRVTVYASCQSPYHLRGHIAANLNYPVSRVKVVQVFTGGSFGGKDDVATEIGSLAAIAAVRTGRPVRIVHDREESIMGSNLRHASRIYYRTGAKHDGTIVAREFRILLDGGAYASESPFVAMKTLIHATGPYNIPHVRGESCVVYTNKTYAGAFRGFGVPQVTFASESQIDELALALQMDPLELRRRNGLRPGDATGTGQVFEKSVGLITCIDRIDQCREDSMEAPEKSSGRWLYGTGYSCVIQGISNGAEGIDVVGASVQAMQDGSILVGIGLTELGQGSRTVYAQIAAEELGVTLDNVTVRPVDTDSVHDSGPTVASRSTTVGGMAVLKAAREVRKSLITMASLMFKAAEEMVVLKDNHAVLSVNDSARIPLRDVATAAYWTGFPLMNLAFSKAPEARYDENTTQGDIYIAYNFGCHLMRIRIDRFTGLVEVLRHVAAHDLGKIINPLGVEGQVMGASLMGFGMAHLEKIQQKGGYILNANFSDYAVPTIKDRIPTETVTVEDYNPTGPYGAKGIGEPPVAGTAAAFANAVAAATRTRFTRLPITRQDIVRALKDKRT